MSLSTQPSPEEYRRRQRDYLASLPVGWNTDGFSPSTSEQVDVAVIDSATTAHEALPEAEQGVWYLLPCEDSGGIQSGLADLGVGVVMGYSEVLVGEESKAPHVDVVAAVEFYLDGYIAHVLALAKSGDAKQHFNDFVQFDCATSPTQARTAATEITEMRDRLVAEANQWLREQDAS